MAQSNKKAKIGFWGAISVVLILALQSIEHWTAIDTVLVALRNMGSSGALFARILVSPILPLAIAVTTLCLIYERSKETADSEPTQTTTDNSAKQTQTTGNVTQQVFLAKNFDQPKSDEKEEVPSVSYIQAKQTLGDDNSTATWREGSTNLQSAHPLLVAEFKNKPKNLGEKTAKASSVSANLVFRGAGNSEELHISHGTWLNEYTQRVTFGSGVSQYLIVAAKCGNQFVTLENPRTVNPFAGRRFRSGTVIHHAQPIELPAKEGEVEITLIDAWGYTVFSGRFAYEVAPEKMTLNPAAASTMARAASSSER
jgi:hypothetical protein